MFSLGYAGRGPQVFAGRAGCLTWPVQAAPAPHVAVAAVATAGPGGVDELLSVVASARPSASVPSGPHQGPCSDTRMRRAQLTAGLQTASVSLWGSF